MVEGRTRKEQEGRREVAEEMIAADVLSLRSAAGCGVDPSAEEPFDLQRTKAFPASANSLLTAAEILA